MVIALVLFAACSGDNGTEPKDPGGGGGGGGGGVVTHEDSLRVETLQAFATQLEQWSGESPDSIAAHAVAYLKDLPSVINAGITPGTTTVWANFTGNFDLVVPNNRNASSQTDTLVDAQSVPTPPRAQSMPRSSGTRGRSTVRRAVVPESARNIPESVRFRALNAIGGCHLNPVPAIRALLANGHYDDALPGAPTVAGLLNSVHGDGVFYINSHGGPGFDALANPYYAVWTLDRVEKATLANYKALVDSHELVGMVEFSNDAMGNCTCVMHYGFTSTFVRRHMSFTKNSLVIVDACSSASDPAGDMRAAFGAVGASAYLGWTKSVEAPFAYAAMKYLIDRLLGINVISPESPPQRAFNIDQVLNDMQAHRNLRVDPAHNSVLTVFHLKDDFGLLSPSIQFLSIDDDGQQPRLIIAGLFGEDPGEGKRSVTINGQELDNVEWFPTEINCDIPESGSNASGTVVVKVGSGSDDRESNPVNITEWDGELTYNRDDPGSLAAEMTIKIRILADIHPFREEPGEAPFETTVLFPPRGDTSVHMTTSGTYEENLGSCKDTYTFGEGGDIGTPFGTGNGKDGSWIFFGSVDTQSHTLQLNIAVLGVFKAGTYVRTQVGEEHCDTFNLPQWVSIFIDDCLYDDLAQSPAFRMQMGDDFTVPGDERGPCDADDPLIGEVNDNHAQGKIKWGEMIPFFLPDTDAAR